MACKYPVKKMRKTTHGNVYYQHPCGQCMPCRITRRNSWKLRIMQEAQCYSLGHDPLKPKQMPEVFFVTLTPRKDFLEYARHPITGEKSQTGTLNPEHLRTFFKRLRQEVDMSFRYVAVGEYGKPENSSLPHYHLMLFGIPETHVYQAVYKAWSELDRTCESQEIYNQQLATIARHRSSGYKQRIQLIKQFGHHTVMFSKPYSDENQEYVTYKNPTYDRFDRRSRKYLSFPVRLPTKDAKTGLPIPRRQVRGRIGIDAYTKERAGYIAGYIVKNETTSKSFEDGRYPEFKRQSNRPGIGAYAMDALAKKLKQKRVCFDEYPETATPDPQTGKKPVMSIPFPKYFESKSVFTHKYASKQLTPNKSGRIRQDPGLLDKSDPKYCQPNIDDTIEHISSPQVTERLVTSKLPVDAYMQKRLKLAMNIDLQKEEDQKDSRLNVERNNLGFRLHNLSIALDSDYALDQLLAQSEQDERNRKSEEHYRNLLNVRDL